MKRIALIFSLIALLLTLSQNASATRQVRDIIIINNVEHKLNKTLESSMVHTDFKGLLDEYKDKKGRVFASWISGTFICGTGECLYAASNGFDSVYQQETELVVEN